MSKDNRNRNNNNNHNNNSGNGGHDSYDLDFAIKPVAEGTARYSNMYNNIAVKNVNFGLDGNDKVECFPYVRASVGVDFFKDIDDDPLHTSLPSGTYDGTAYTHSDNCLTNKYPRLAARLIPVARYYIKQQYTTSNPTRETLVVDAIGGMLAASAKAYGIALAEARVRSGYRKLDENRNFFGAWVLDSLGLEWGKYSSLAIGSAKFKEDYTASLSDQDAIINSLKSIHNESVSQFANEINAYLTDVYLSNRMKALVKLLCGNIIQGRYADADSTRYYVFSIDEQLAEVAVSFNDAKTKVQNYANNHLKVFLNRFTFLPELLANIGVYQINNKEKDKVTIESDGDILSIVVDDNDAIKNCIDHMALTYDDINGMGNNTKDFSRDAIFIEADSYLKGSLEIGDYVDVTDAIMSVLLKDGLRSYNVKTFEVSKVGTNTTPTMMQSIMPPKPIMLKATLIAQLSATQVGEANAANAIFNTTKIVDPTVTIEYGDAATVIDVEKFIFRTAINTYLSPRFEQSIIAQDCLEVIAFDVDKLDKANSTLANDKDSKNNVA